MNLTPEHIGMLKGATATALLFIAGIAIGLFFLHRKHEEEMDKLVLAPGENRHFEPGENSQFQPGRNRQSVPGGCSQPRFGYRF